MSTKKIHKAVLQDDKVSVKMKIATLWASFMFLYIYVDYFHLYMPGSLQDMLAGKVYLFDVSQAFLIASLVSITIPALMIAASAALPARLSRWLNVFIATLYIPYSLFNLAGEAWFHMMIAAAVEVGILLLVIRYAWSWPRVEGQGSVSAGEI